MPMTNGLFVYDVNELPELAREYNIRHRLVVWAIAQNWRSLVKQVEVRGAPTYRVPSRR